MSHTETRVKVVRDGKVVEDDYIFWLEVNGNEVSIGFHGSDHHMNFRLREVDSVEIKLLEVPATYYARFEKGEELEKP